MALDIPKLPQLPAVYKFTNKINGKVYIGKSVRLRKRIYDHKANEQWPLNIGGRFIKAIRKYGFDNFDFEIIELHKERNWFTEQFIIDQEEMWIEYYNSTNPDFGYNSCIKDTNQLGRSPSEETRAKLSKHFKGLCSGEESRLWGKPRSAEVKEKIKRSRTPTNIKPVNQIDVRTGEVIKTFSSLAEAARSFDVKFSTFKSGIYKSNKFNRTYLDFKWKYEPSFNEYKKYKNIQKLDLKTKEVIQIYSTLADAARDTLVTRGSLRRAVKGLGSCAGFLWKGEF